MDYEGVDVDWQFQQSMGSSSVVISLHFYQGWISDDGTSFRKRCQKGSLSAFSGQLGWWIKEMGKPKLCDIGVAALWFVINWEQGWNQSWSLRESKSKKLETVWSKWSKLGSCSRQYTMWVHTLKIMYNYRLHFGFFPVVFVWGSGQHYSSNASGKTETLFVTLWL